MIPPREAANARERVLQHVRGLMERGALGPGDRLPSERELAASLRLSRPSVRSGLETLEALGIVVARRGAGTFVVDGPPGQRGPLGLLASLHGFTSAEMFAARLLLEVGVARLAAEHADAEHLASLAEEVTEMFAALEDPQSFLVHDVRFHRAVGAASGNRVLAALVEMVAAQFYDRRRRTVDRARDLRESAQLHRNVYRAIRARDGDAAAAAMAEHLRRAEHAQDLEAAGAGPRSVDP